MPKFSANLGFLWSDLPMLDRVRAAAKQGFKAVEFHWPYATPARELKAACDDLGLAIVGVNSGSGDAAAGEFGLSAVPGQEQRFRDDLNMVADYAAEIGAPRVHVMAGVAAPERRAEALAVYRANLAYAAERCGARGVGVLIEPLNRHSRANYVLNSSDQAAALIDELGLPNVQMLFDVFHVGRADGDVTYRLEQYFGKIGHIQVASVPARAEPGDGEIDYGFVLRKVDALGYAGWVGCEYFPVTTPEAGMGWVQKLGYTL